MLKIKFYFNKDLAELKVGELILNTVDYMNIVDVDERNYTIIVEAEKSKIEMSSLMCVKYLACPTKVEILE